MRLTPASASSATLNVGTGGFERLQPPDGVVQVGTAPEEVLAARGQDEIVRKRIAGFRRGLDSFDR